MTQLLNLLSILFLVWSQLNCKQILKTNGFIKLSYDALSIWHYCTVNESQMHFQMLVKESLLIHGLGQASQTTHQY